MKNNEQELKAFIEVLTEGFSDEELLETTMRAQIASSIVTARLRKGWTQADLADATRVSQAQVSKWEKGSQNYSLSTLVKLSLALEIELKNPLQVQGKFQYSVASSNDSKIIQFYPNYYASSNYTATGWTSSGSSDTLEETFMEG